MLIKETIERECCDPDKDFLDYNGSVQYLDICPQNVKVKFCKHCGQIWSWYDYNNEWHTIFAIVDC